MCSEPLCASSGTSTTRRTSPRLRSSMRTVQCSGARNPSRRVRGCSRSPRTCAAGGSAPRCAAPVRRSSTPTSLRLPSPPPSRPTSSVTLLLACRRSSAPSSSCARSPGSRTTRSPRTSGSTVGAVQMLLFRARQTLRAELEPPPVTRISRGLVVPIPGWLTGLVARADTLTLTPRAASVAGAAVLAGVGVTTGLADSPPDRPVSRVVHESVVPPGNDQPVAAALVSKPLPAPARPAVRTRARAVSKAPNAKAPARRSPRQHPQGHPRRRLHNPHRPRRSAARSSALQWRPRRVAEPRRSRRSPRRLLQ